MDKIKHIENSINKAINETSKLDNNILNIFGYTSNKIRHLLNNILELENSNYLEIGTHQGSTFAAALYKNNLNSAYAIDNWTEFNKDNSVKTNFLKNTELFNFTMIEENCWKLDLNKINNKINIYPNDGPHTYNYHYNALTYYYSVLNNEFIFMVDDFDPSPNWEQVERATRDAIKDLNLKIIYEKHLKSNVKNDSNLWWGGFYISILSK